MEQVFMEVQKDGIEHLKHQGLMEKYALALLANKKYLEFTKQVYYSAKRFGNWPHDFLLLAYEIDDQDPGLQWFKNRNIQIFHINQQTFPFTVINPQKTVYFSKLFLFHPCLNAWDKIVYLDTDVLVRKDLSKLLAYKGFAAADDCFQNPVIHQLSPPGKPYGEAEINKYFDWNTLTKISFNSGLMVVKSKENSTELYEELLALTNKFGPHSVFFDQGVLNLYFNEKRERIPYVFNDYFGSEPFNRKGLLRRFSDKNAVVLHIIHPAKPWDNSSTYYPEWKRNMDLASHFPDVAPIGRTPSQISVFLVDLINEFNIRMVYALGNARYRLWLVASFIKRNVFIWPKE